ncbi:MAG TPA: EAL domain-containing protein [Phycisphaerae bacterium]|nr:EAL domain-containing protein [Phycisphaerae bacterium]
MNDQPERRRILVIDDTDSIHSDFRKTLAPRTQVQRLASAAAFLFGDSPATPAAATPSFEMESAMQGQEGFEKVRAAVAENRPFAMAFVDMRMPPGWDGVETIEHLWQVDPELQVVICTAFSDHTWDDIIARLGTTDRLLILKKPFDPVEVCQLATALSEKRKLKRQATLKLADLERMVHERTSDLQRLALQDRLTGLPNRAWLMEQLTTLVAKNAGAAPTPFALLFLDFDRFKMVNDSLGHNAGDELLKAISARLTDALADYAAAGGKPAACAARLGGDEFVVLQPGVASINDAVDMARRLSEKLAAPYHIQNVPVHSTASIGIALADSAYQWADDVLRDADTAMYRAKTKARGSWTIFTPEMRKEAIARLTLENDLRRALENREFVLHYQPILSLEDARLTGFEALLRWNHPQRGLILPDEFIPVTEETGMILQLGEWVLTEAARQLQEWSSRYPAARNLAVSVNTSRRQLIAPPFLSIVEKALAATQLEPHRLNLEITESVFIQDHNHVRDVLQRIRAMNVGVHMDDFGTGYSSLNCLHGLPLNVLKVDRSFIQNVSLRRDYAAVVDAIIVLAHNLGMKVIAEGVESADHLAMLSGLDCDAAQGNFFSPPMPAADTEAFIRQRLSHKPGAHFTLSNAATAH